MSKPLYEPIAVRAPLPRAEWPSYAIALVLTVACAWGRMALIQGPRPVAPFLLFYPAIAIAAYTGGIGPAGLVVAGSAVFGMFVFPVFPPLSAWGLLSVAGSGIAFAFSRLRNLRERSKMIAAESTRLRFVIENVSDWIFLVNEGGRIEYSNQSACSQLGFTPEEFSGRSIQEFEFRSQKPVLAELVARSKDGAVPPAEITFVRRDGLRISVEVSCTSIQTGSATVIHVAARDVTERKHLDQKLREARQWESLGALTGGLAHDFNNLLTAIMGNASLARDRVGDDAEACELLEAVEKAGERCAELIRMMLATSGYRNRNTEKLRVDRLIEEAIASNPVPAGVKIRVEAGPCEFHSDRGTVETLLKSLIANAAESYGSAAGEVTVSVREGKVPAFGEANFHEGEPQDGAYLGIVVEDKGCGMTREVVERAFNPFFSTKFTGRGLGLPAVRGIVRAHSGVLWLRTAPGDGTRVEVWLPAAGYHLVKPTPARL